MALLSYLFLELGTVALFGLMVWHASRRGRGLVLELLTAAVFGVLLEWGDILLFGTYTYSPGFVLAIGPVPIIIGLCWAMLIYGAMHFSDTLGIPTRLAPFADAIWAIVLDLAFDAIAIRLDFWTWNIRLDDGFFGVPAGNFHAWLYVALGFSAMTRLARARPAQRTRLQLLTPISAYLILVAAILFFDLLIVIFYPGQAQGDRGMAIFAATLAIFAAVTGYGVLRSRHSARGHFTLFDIIPTLARWSMHLYFGAWLVIWLVWPQMRLPGKDLPPMLLVVAAVMLAAEFLLLVPLFVYREPTPAPASRRIFKEHQIMRLDGQVVVVTGASRGLGRAIALAMAEEGADVILAARDGQALNAVASIIEGIGGSAFVVRCDVRDPAAVKALSERVLGEYGRVDTLVNSAGVALRRPLVETTPEAWDEIFDVLVRGTMLVTQALLPAMIARKRGNIINLAAPLGQIETSGFAAYAAAKHAVVGLTRTLAKELRPYRINVNGLHPGGFVDTAMVRGVMGAPGTPGFPAHLLDPSIITPAAIALAAQPGYGLSGDIVDAVAWNTDAGLGAGIG